MEARIKLPRKVAEVFAPERGAVQYRGLYGGRGSGKSFGAAKMASIWGCVWPLRILCTRELQVSIRESMHAELKAAIASEPWLEAHYDVGVDYIKGRNGTEFIFRGLRHNTTAIKSLAKIDLTIVEEAEDVPEDSWLALEATVFRQSKSELWAIWNPRNEATKDKDGRWTGSPVDARFRKNPPPNAIIRKVNYSDNPFFPVGLETLRKREQERLDPATYAHIWDGEYLTNSDAQVLSGKVRVAEFDPLPDWDGPYYGGDFGFSQDPTAAVKCWISGPVLYVEREAVKTGLELDDTARFVIGAIPGFERDVSRWDCSRPESISHLTRHGLPRATACEKWQGSVEDGIGYLRSFAEIVVHPRCTSVVSETRLYSYKVDRLSGDVTSTIVDAHNHTIDAIRYALGPMIRHRSKPVTKSKPLRGLY
jgi:phage terminase large subunit